MNAFDKLIAAGVAQTRAVLGQAVTVGAVAGVPAIVSPLRREVGVDRDGNERWLDAGDVTVGRADWPANAALPQSGQLVTLSDGSRFRIMGDVTYTAALLTFRVGSLY